MSSDRRFRSAESRATRTGLDPHHLGIPHRGRSRQPVSKRASKVIVTAASTLLFSDASITRGSIERAAGIALKWANYLLNFPRRCSRSRLFSQALSKMSLSGTRRTCSLTCHGLV